MNPFCLPRTSTQQKTIRAQGVYMYRSTCVVVTRWLSFFIYKPFVIQYNLFPFSVVECTESERKKSDSRRKCRSKIMYFRFFSIPSLHSVVIVFVFVVAHLVFARRHGHRTQKTEASHILLLRTLLTSQSNFTLRLFLTLWNHMHIVESP